MSADVKIIKGTVIILNKLITAVKDIDNATSPSANFVITLDVTPPGAAAMIITPIAISGGVFKIKINMYATIGRIINWEIKPTIKSFGDLNTLPKSSSFNPRPKPNIIKAKIIGAIFVTISKVLPSKYLDYNFLYNLFRRFFSIYMLSFLTYLKKMLSNKEIVCPNNLLDLAHKKKGVTVAVVNAGKPLPMLSVQDAVNENLIEPIFIGHEVEIQKCAEDIKWDISKFELIHEPVENDTAKIAAKLASEGKVQIIVKGHIHTDVLMKEVLKREYNLLGKTRLSHIWHMTIGKDDKPLIITDGALNVLPNVKTKMHILKNVVNFSNRIGIERPKVSVLSATEEVLESVPSSIEAAEITKLAKEENLNADVFGPLAFDNSISKKSAAIKGIKNLVAGEADVLLVPNVEAGNALVKMLIYFSGACAAGVVVGGKVPVVITSRSDEAQARLASIAAAVVALD